MAARVQPGSTREGGMRPAALTMVKPSLPRAAAAGGGARAPAWPGWLPATALFGANALQVALTWWVLREAATNRRPASEGGGMLRVALLVAANALQTGLTWWVYRREAPASPLHRPTYEAAA